MSARSEEKHAEEAEDSPAGQQPFLNSHLTLMANSIVAGSGRAVLFSIICQAPLTETKRNELVNYSRKICDNAK